MHLALPTLAHLISISQLPFGDASSIISGSAGAACGSNCGGSSITGLFTAITNILIYLIGAISVIMIIIGGLRYVLSNGDPKSAESARNTILYSVIGIIIAIAAYAIVTFVTSNVK